MARSLILSHSALARWDVKGARAAAFRIAHPSFRPLREMVSEATELVRPAEEPDRLWPIYGVSNRRGVVLNEFRQGAAFRAPQKRIEKDWFFHNPTRANVGSLGRVGDVEADALTSPEYQVWKIDHALLPDFMELLLKLNFFRKQIEFNRVGSVKERLFVDNLLDIVVPVPGAEAQRSIVARYRAAESEALELTRHATALRKAVDVQLMQRLGLDDLAAPTRGKVATIRRSAVERWGVAFNLMSTIGAALEAGHHRVERVGALITKLQYGSSAKADADADADDGLPMIRMGNLVDGELDLSDMKFVALNKRETVALLLEDGDILINRTNSKELVGKCAVYHQLAPHVFASYLMRAQCDRRVIDPDYLALVLNAPVGRRQIDRISRQALGMANINSEEIRALRVPVPPLAEQQRIAAGATEQRSAAAEVLDRANSVRATAVREIEHALLSGEF